jgi:hypothetical protein
MLALAHTLSYNFLSFENYDPVLLDRVLQTHQVSALWTYHESTFGKPPPRIDIVTHLIEKCGVAPPTRKDYKWNALNGHLDVIQYMIVKFWETYDCVTSQEYLHVILSAACCKGHIDLVKTVFRLLPEARTYASRYGKHMISVSTETDCLALSLYLVNEVCDPQELYRWNDTWVGNIMIQCIHQGRVAFFKFMATKYQQILSATVVMHGIHRYIAHYARKRDDALSVVRYFLEDYNDGVSQDWILIMSSNGNSTFLDLLLRDAITTDLQDLVRFIIQRYESVVSLSHMHIMGASLEMIMFLTEKYSQKVPMQLLYESLLEDFRIYRRSGRDTFDIIAYILRIKAHQFHYDYPCLVRYCNYVYWSYPLLRGSQPRLTHLCWKKLMRDHQQILSKMRRTINIFTFDELEICAEKIFDKMTTLKLPSTLWHVFYE